MCDLWLAPDSKGLKYFLNPFCANVSIFFNAFQYSAAYIPFRNSSFFLLRATFIKNGILKFSEEYSENSRKYCRFYGGVYFLV